MIRFGWIPLALAAPGDGGQAPQSPMYIFGWMALMAAVFYLILIRPQQRREREKRQLIDAIKSGERVVFAGGLLGIVTNVKEKTFVIKIADGVKVEVARYAVTQVLDKGESPESAPNSK